MQYFSRFNSRKIATTAAAAAALFLVPSAWAQDTAAPKPEAAAPEVEIDKAEINRSAGTVTSFAPVVEKVAPSVVTIFSTKSVKRDPRIEQLLRDPQMRRFFGIPGHGGMGPGARGKIQGLGSGVIVSKEGHVLTNNHVIDGADEIMVSIGTDKREYRAEKIGVDPLTDLALLKIEPKSDLTPIVFADSESVKPGDVALAIGSPFGLTQSVSMGIVSAVGRGGMGIADFEDFIQTDAAINMGNSGGALVDAGGRLIGINTAIRSNVGGGNLGIGFAVPANLARNVMKNIMANGRVVRGFIGVIVQPLSQELADAFKIESGEGALVSDVSAGGPADKAGVRNGDVILRVNEESISDPQDLMLTVGGMNPGEDVKVTIVRDGQEKQLAMKLSERPGKDAPIADMGTTGKSNVLDGITIGDIDDAARAQYKIPADVKGVLVTQLDPESAGAAAGLQVGDVVMEMNRKELTDSNQAVDLSNEIEKDETVLLRIASNGKSRFVVLKPENAEDVQ